MYEKYKKEDRYEMRYVMPKTGEIKKRNNVYWRVYRLSRHSRSSD